MVTGATIISVTTREFVATVTGETLRKQPSATPVFTVQLISVNSVQFTGSNVEFKLAFKFRFRLLNKPLSTRTTILIRLTINFSARCPASSLPKNTSVTKLSTTGIEVPSIVNILVPIARVEKENNMNGTVVENSLMTASIPQSLPTFPWPPVSTNTKTSTASLVNIMCRSVNVNELNLGIFI